MLWYSLGRSGSSSSSAHGANNQYLTESRHPRESEPIIAVAIGKQVLHAEYKRIVKGGQRIPKCVVSSINFYLKRMVSRKHRVLQDQRNKEETGPHDQI